MTALVFVPGLLCTQTLWAHQVAYLADVAECQVADVSRAPSIEAMATSVLEQAPPSFALCGLSMGGIVANAIMRMAPERVTRLALLDTNARQETAEQTARRDALIALAESGEFAAVSATLMPALLHPDRLDDVDLTGAVADMATELGPEVFVRQVRAIISRPEALSGLSAYRCPTLVLCGREDAITSLQMHEEIAANIPSAKLAVIEQCGHMSTMERPHAVTALLRQWLLY
jgi:pimeloyl-ACP methyl ester carboxylesterase